MDAQAVADRLISIHALREEGDNHRWRATYETFTFLSTPSARRATVLQSRLCIQTINFYPRPPRGGRRVPKWGDIMALSISIHALREEGDSKNRDKISIFKQIIQHSARI